MGNTTKDLLKGALAGAVAVWVMDRLTWYMYRNEDPKAQEKGKKAQIDGKYASQVAASRLAGSLGIQLTEKQELAAAKVIHYLLGILPGAMYGAFRSDTKGLTIGRGLVYGAGLFIVMDELIAPLAGLASGPKAYPWQAHVRGLAGHLTVGATTDTVVAMLNKLMAEKQEEGQ